MVDASGQGVETDAQDNGSLAIVPVETKKRKAANQSVGSMAEESKALKMLEDMAAADGGSVLAIPAEKESMFQIQDHWHATDAKCSKCLEVGG